MLRVEKWSLAVQHTQRVRVTVQVQRKIQDVHATEYDKGVIEVSSAGRAT